MHALCWRWQGKEILKCSLRSNELLQYFKNVRGLIAECLRADSECLVWGFFFFSTPPRPHLRADCHWGRISFWRSLLFGVFHCKPGSSDTGEHFFIDCLFSTTIIFPTITPVKYHSNRATLPTVHLLIVHIQRTNVLSLLLFHQVGLGLWMLKSHCLGCLIHVSKYPGMFRSSMHI